MRIVLHIGQPKTGSSALQYAFTLAHHDLAKCGILYPLLKPHDDISAHWLLAAGGDFTPRFAARVTAAYRQYGKENGIENAFASLCADIEAQISMHRPDTLVLSCEGFFRVITPARMCEWMRSLSSEIEVVAYVRDAPGLYLASVQQLLRSGYAELPQPHGNPIDAVIGSYRMAFDRVHVQHYLNGDIVADFSKRHLGIEMQGKRLHSGISAEAMSVLLELNRRGLPRRLGRLIAFAMGDAPKAILRADIVHPVRDVEDICHVNESLKQELMLRALRWMAETGYESLSRSHYEARYPEKTQMLPSEVHDAIRDHGARAQRAGTRDASSRSSGITRRRHSASDR